ncbi:hypothetical protein FISHEDRAFT_55245 [Fistulina hepatica ATCC 64428]|uniref:Uncharacterized protein n=1 Tax=Fistulina hepatica ATCC 64428 TaxID=1128425 RepID=A0A0D7AP91_9AGAR|nr:hypothetical protein FISHEDRAFT_55245 [Fistulina hepatica ATCC 64428]
MSNVSPTDERKPITRREPNQRYAGRNGFLDKDPPGADLAEQQNWHRQAMFVLTQKDRPIPSLSRMKEIVNSRVDKSPAARIERIDRRLRDLDSRHLEDLQRLYAAQASDYLTEQMDKAASYDDVYLNSTKGTDDDHDNPRQLVEAMYAVDRHPEKSYFARIQEDEVDRHRYGYLRTRLALQKEKAAILAAERDREERERRAWEEQRRQEEEQRRIEELAFPRSYELYMKRDETVRARAREVYYEKNENKRRRLMEQFGWLAPRDFDALQRFIEDVKMKGKHSEILAYIVQDQMNPKPRVQKATDPRRRPI